MQKSREGDDIETQLIDIKCDSKLQTFQSEISQSLDILYQALGSMDSPARRASRRYKRLHAPQEQRHELLKILLQLKQISITSAPQGTEVAVEASEESDESDWPTLSLVQAEAYDQEDRDVGMQIFDNATSRFCTEGVSKNTSSRYRLDEELFEPSPPRPECISGQITCSMCIRRIDVQRRVPGAFAHCPFICMS